MKILRLDLTAFGPFTNQTLSLDAGQHGLHLIYGPNEAGKSSSLRALHHWLYGIPNTSADNFLHPYSSLRIGGLLESSTGKRLEFIRRKGQKNTLRAIDDSTIVDEAELAEMLGGIDVGTFSQQYGISYAELQRGGQAIVRGGGDLGEILFSAGTGLADLGQIQKALSNESDALFKKSGRAQRITQAISELAGVRKALREATLSTADWVARDNALQNATRHQQKLEDDLKSLRAQAGRWERIVVALPLIRQRRTLTTLLAELGNVPPLPENFRSLRTETQRQLRTQEQFIQDASETLAKLRSRIAGVTIPEELLRHRTVITQLHTELGGIQKAARDRPQLISRADAAMHQLSRILQDLGHPPQLERVEELRLSKLQRQRIQSLAGEWRALNDRLESAARQESKLRTALLDIERQLAELPPALEMTETRRAIRRTQKGGDLDQQRATARRLLAELEQQTEIALQQMPLWNGSLEELERLAIPSLETIERFENESRDGAAEVVRLSGLIKELADQMQRLDQKLEELRLQYDIPSEDDLKKARDERDQSWLALRQFLSPSPSHKTASSEEPGTAALESSPVHAFPAELVHDFQLRLEQADVIADRLRYEADRVAEKTSLTAEKLTREETHSRLMQALRSANDSVQQSLEKWKELWSPLRIEPFSPREMRSWVHQQQQVARVAAEIRQQRSLVAHLDAQIQTFRKELLKTLPDQLHPQDDSGDLSSLVDRVEEFIIENDADNRKRQKLEDRQKTLQGELPSAQEEVRIAREALEKWSAEWSGAVAALRLERAASPAEATSVLESFEEIFQFEKEIRELQERIAGIDRDAEQFQGSVEQLLMQTGPDLLSHPPHQAIADLSDRLAAASAAQAKQQECSDAMESEENRLEAAEKAAERLRSDLLDLCQAAGCDTVEQLPELEQQAERARALQQELDSITRQLEHQAGGMALDSFEREAEGVDQDELNARLVQTHEEITRLEAEKTEVIRSAGEHSAILQQMNGSPQAAAAQEQAEQLLARIRADSEEYIRLRLASVLLQRTVDRFRETSQGPVLKRACELFAHLTLGAFLGVRPEYDEKGNAVLVGIRAVDNREVHVDGMSEGTCDQLYLALRIALLEQSLQAREPLPLIVDDILVMFDNRRATAALEALAELSVKTQVILFTHHQHIVELGKNLGRSDVVHVHSLSS